MYPNPWATPAPQPAATKPIPIANNTQSYPFYAAQNVLQNMPQINQQNLTSNTPSAMNKSIQPNAIDPAMVQKWQEWKQWELWQQQFQQWQQQTGQIAAPTTQPCPPPMPPSQPFQTLQPNTIQFHNQQYPYSQPGPPLPLTNPPLPTQQNTIQNEVGMKRGLEPDFQSNEKKLKTESVSNKKEIELNEETEALLEEQFKSWEEKFFKWKEQNKDHPDKTQYLEYEKKWINWRDHLKQKCEILKKKREVKLAEKKKENNQAEENQLQTQQKLGYNTMVTPNVSTLTNDHPNPQNNITSTVPSSENQIPGLDLASNNENLSKGFLNVSKILPQNQNGPIQTPDDKPFNFPKSVTNPTAVNPHLNMPPFGNINQPPTSMYQNSPNWSNNKYNNPVLYNNRTAPDVDIASMPRFGQQNDEDFRSPYGENESNAMYRNSQNAPNMNPRRPLDGPYNKSLNEPNNFYNQRSGDQSYNTNLNTSASNFQNYNQSNKNISSFNNFNKPPEKYNISNKHLAMSSNIPTSKPPSLLSLNVVKPFLLDKPCDYSENKNTVPNRYEKNWNINDEDEDPENEYMEAHKKFSSEPFDEQHFDDQFSNNKHYKNMYNDNSYSRGQGGRKKFNNDYSRPMNHSRGSQMMRNTDNEFFRPNSQYSINEGQNFPRETQTFKNNEADYYNPQNNMQRDQEFPRGEKPFVEDVGDEYSEPPIENNNFVPQKKNYGPSSRANYGPPSRGKYGPPPRGNYGSHARENYEPPKENFGNNTSQTNVEWDKDYSDNERPLPIIEDTIIPPPVVKLPYQAPPIDPIKIFDYRHLPTLKVIPGLTKETMIPIRNYDHKHGGKRILPWKDRGYSRRNSNHTRDLNEKEVAGFGQNNSNELVKNKDTSMAKSTTIIDDPVDISSNEKDPNLDQNKTVIIEDDIKEDKMSTIVDTITIDDDDNDDNDVKEEKQPTPIVETIDISAPSPPKVSYSKVVEKTPPRQLLPIETLLCPPGRFNRPSKIVIILRGLPGSGKSYIARLIKEKEVSMGGQAPRILSLDDYFMTEITKTEIDPETNKKVEVKEMEYEHDDANESLYRTSFIKAFKKKILENYFSFFIIDAINNKVTYYKDIMDIARVNGFTTYIIELESDVDLCIKRNIHKRTAHDINNIIRSWVKTPSDQILLDIRSLFNSPSQSEVEMEDVSDIEMELDKDEDMVETNQLEEDKSTEIEEEDVMKLLSCKWTDTIPQEEKMKRLDGLCKKKTESSIKEWLQIPEDYTISEEVIVKDGKKRVRWADMEERREQEKMRAIGFVVGQTNWDRMLGRDQGESKLTQTKYI